MPPTAPCLQSETIDGVTVVLLLNERIVDDLTLMTVRDALNKFVDEHKPSRLVVNLSKVKNYTTPFLGTLIGSKARLKKLKGEMKVCCVAPDLMVAVKILGLVRELDIHPEEQAAIDDF